jgi:porphobilinogen synthase
VLPVFVHAGDGDTPLQSMPGVTRWGLEGLVAEAGRAAALGIRGLVLFPKVDDPLKTPDGAECHNPEGLVPQAISAIKAAHPDLLVITDVALDPYSSDGHDGIVGPGGHVMNDETVAVLTRQALCHARAGADVISPSDMMDGRVQAIREALDGEGFTHVAIMSYTAKYASAFYGPFRGALDSAPKDGDKKGYQMDPGNAREALREYQLDVDEGADIVMVKPAGPYLDVIRRVADVATVGVSVPLAAAGTSNVAPQAGTINVAPQAGTINVAPQAGTINIAAVLEVPLGDAGLVNAVQTAVEAKAQALAEGGLRAVNHDGPATGTATDSLLICCPTPDPALAPASVFAGPATSIGHDLAHAVHTAVTDGLARWRARH